MYVSKYFNVCRCVCFHVSIYLYMFDCELCIFFYGVQLEQKLHWLQSRLNCKGKRMIHAHTTVTPFVHELDIACKNVLISHNSMMLAALVSSCTK